MASSYLWLGFLRARTLLVALALLVVACTPDAPRDGPDTLVPLPKPPPGATLLPAPARLVRVAMALRGVRPTAAELARVRKDPAALGAIVDAYLKTPEFGATIRELHDRALLLRTDAQILPMGFPAIGPLSGVTLTALNGSLAEAPLRLIEHVVTRGRPYSEIVTAGYMLADAVVAQVWGSTSFDPKGAPWQVARWTDGRPAAGVLASSDFYARHTSTISNANRGRAAVVARVFLCYDFANRNLPVDTSVDLASPDAVASAVEKIPACRSCHRDLDPLAALFHRFEPIFAPPELSGYPRASYHPASRGTPPWIAKHGMTRKQPGYFGKAARDLGDLGRLIAADPRFPRCAARRFYAFFHQVPLADVPREAADRLSKRFVARGLDARALVRDIVMADDFAVSHATGTAGAETLVGFKRATPEQLDRLFYDLTGFRWRANLPLSVDTAEKRGKVGVVNLLTDSFFGYRVLAGGTDGYYVTEPARLYNATASLVLRRLAAEAANHVVTRDLATTDRGKRKLLRLVGAADREPSLVRRQLAAIHARLFGDAARPDDADVARSYDLFTRALAIGRSPTRAWKVVLAALLQSPEIAFY